MPPAKRKSKGTLREKDNVVSVWLGTMRSDDALAAYVDDDDDGSPFARDLGVSVEDVEFIESSFSEADAPSEILAGHTFASQYATAAEAAATKLGLRRVNSAVIVLDRAYDPVGETTCAGGALQFVGVFAYDPDA
jgi:hypothetical protein